MALPSLKIEGMETVAEGTYKTAHPYPNDEHKLILAFKKDGAAEFFKSYEQVFSPEQVRAYFYSQFYARKILHGLFANVFPDCLFMNNKVLVVEKIQGEKVGWNDLT